MIKFFVFLLILWLLWPLIHRWFLGFVIGRVQSRINEQMRGAQSQQRQHKHADKSSEHREKLGLDEIEARRFSSDNKADEYVDFEELPK